MANRFPLIVDSSGSAAIKEIASGDNLDLTGNGIVGAGTVALTNLTVGGSQGNDGQVLTSTGSGIAWEDASAGGGGGAWNFISTTSVGANTSSVELTLSNYDEYVVRFSGINGGTSEFFPRLEFQDSGQSSYSSIFYNLRAHRYGSSVYASTASSSSIPLLSNRVYSADGNYSGEIRIANVPGQPTAFGNAFVIDQYNQSNPAAGYIHYVVGLSAASSTEVFSKVKIRADSGNMQAGTVYLYGITTS